MNRHITIPREKSADDLSFIYLRRQGIEHIQQASGQLWTDYNVHDPGITILEHLCYGLTDLNYQADRDVADFLTEENGGIDFENLALLPPEDVLPCRPITILDYRKAILDAVPEIRDIWISELDISRIRGLYILTVSGDTKIMESEQTQKLTAEKIIRAFRKIRNLCEDIDVITFVEQAKCKLKASIEIEGSRMPTDILGEVYRVADARISPQIEFRSYESEQEAGLDLEEIYDGPHTSRGHIRDDEFTKTDEELRIADIVNDLKNIEGIKHIRSLYLAVEKEDTAPIRYDDSVPRKEGNTLLHLHIPTADDEIGVQLLKGQRLLHIPIDDLEARCFGKQDMRNMPFSSNSARRWISGAPKGKYFDFKYYHSIQKHFPPRYGIGEHGLPAHASRAEQAKALQLKAYLLLFEQIMANHAANLQHLKAFFSLGKDGKMSYATEALDDTCIPEANLLYITNSPDWLGGLQKRYDSYVDRKGRLLDYLLALHGERLPQHSLTHFSQYLNPDQVRSSVLENKKNMLRNIVTLNRDRATAADYGLWLSGAQNMSGLEAKARLLLNFASFKPSMTAVLSMYMKKMKLQNANEKIKPLRLKILPDVDSGRSADSQNVPLKSRIQLANDEIDRLAEDQISALGGNIYLPLLQKGIFLNRYRIVPDKNGGEIYQLYINIKDEEKEEKKKEKGYIPLCAYKEKEEAINAVNALRYKLIQLNKQSEGMYVVEHVLLRPMLSSLSSPSKDMEDFFNFRLSVILPSWTARCHDKKFRLLARETISLICPAHLCPTLHWLDFTEMKKFERLFFLWSKLKNEDEPDLDELDEKAEELIAFLQFSECRQDMECMP